MDQETLEECLRYATELYASGSETHGWIRRQLAERQLPEIQISPLEGRLLAVLAASAGATRLLEIGTLGGSSALWLVSLLPGHARLVTLEKDPGHAELAREAFQRAGEEDRIELRVGDAREELEGLAAGPPFDLVFIDADKTGYPTYLEASASLLRPGGLVLADNTFWRGRVASEAEGEDASTAAIRAFNRTVAEDPRFQGVIVPIRDGLTLARFTG